MSTNNTASGREICALTDIITDAISAYARNGDTLSCDVLHGARATLDNAMALLLGEDEHVAQLLAGVKS